MRITTIIAAFLFAAVGFADEPARFRISPKPMDPTELPPPVELPDDNPHPPEAARKEAEPESSHDSERADLGARPLVYLYTHSGCLSGQLMHAAVERGDLADLNVVERPPPEWYTTCPTWHWQDSTGQWRQSNATSVSAFLATFDRMNPGARLKVAASRGAVGSSPFGQIEKFTGAGGRFSFVPDKPIAASLDDRTSIAFPSIQGRYAVRDGKVELKLDPPLPTGNYRKWLNFGFQITGAGGPENVTSTTADIRIDTNRGAQRVTIQMEPVKP